MENTLRTFRKFMDYSARDIYELLQVTKGCYYQWETGKRTPRQHHREKLAEYFGVPVRYLFPATKEDLSDAKKALKKAIKLLS